MLFIIDNYDSFVYNILHTIDYPEDNIIIRRNDNFSINDIEKLNVARYHSLYFSECWLNNEGM